MGLVGRWSVDTELKPTSSRESLSRAREEVGQQVWKKHNGRDNKHDGLNASIASPVLGWWKHTQPKGG